MSTQTILERMRAAVTATDSEWDVPLGSPEYKILEAAANEINRALNGGILRTYHWDVESYASTELDTFVGMFGVVRRSARRATGTVILSRGTPAERDFYIPTGSQVMRPDGNSMPRIVFQVTSPATLQTGGTQVEVPIEAMVPGVAGNVVSGDISVMGTNITGVTAVTNASGTTGGLAAETDTELRARWRMYSFRSIAGTSDQIVSNAMEHDDVTRALLLGPYTRIRESLQIVDDSGLKVTSQNAWAKYVYPLGGEFFGYDIGADIEILGVEGVDHTFTDSNPPVVDIITRAQTQTITVNATAGTFTVTWSGQTTSALAFNISAADFTTALVALSNIALGDVVVTGGPGDSGGTTPYTLTWENAAILPTTNAASLTGGAATAAVAAVDDLFPVDSLVQLDYQYVPTDSRNDPVNSIFNRLDLFVAGTTAVAKTETVPDSIFGTFNNTGGSPMLRTQWDRTDGTNPADANIFMPLFYTPVYTIPNEIVVGVTTYTEGTHYWLVRDNTELRGSPRCRDGIEWDASPGAPVTVEYMSNVLPLEINERVGLLGLAGMDILTHTVRQANLRFNISVVYSFGYSGGDVSEEVSDLLSAWLETMEFRGSIQVSDMIDVIKDSAGVDNVRLTTSSQDAVNYGIQEIAEDGATILATHTTDLDLSPTTVPSLHSVDITPLASNTF